MPDDFELNFDRIFRLEDRTKQSVIDAIWDTYKIQYRSFEEAKKFVTETLDHIGLNEDLIKDGDFD